MRVRSSGSNVTPTPTVCANDGADALNTPTVAKASTTFFMINLQEGIGPSPVLTAIGRQADSFRKKCRFQRRAAGLLTASDRSPLELLALI
jgi:hypothetical protein